MASGADSPGSSLSRRLTAVVTRMAAALGRVPHLPAHLALSGSFLLSRYLLDLAGVRFNLILDWMFMSDPADLRDRLLQTIYYAHGFPPGMNLLAGLLMKLDESRLVTNAHALFQLLGLLLVNALFYLGRALGLSLMGSLVLALAICLSPQVIYFEHLWIYEIPVVALLCLAAALFHRGTQRPGFWPWFGCFLSCAIIGWIRSSFHLVWFAALVGLALWCGGAGNRRRILATASGPGLLLLALYLKNLVVFGVFGALTWGSGSLATATIRNLPPDIKQAWVSQGKLSPYAAHSVYAGPREFLRYFPGSADRRWPPMLNVLERPTLGTPNFNHWFFLEINRRRRQDALVYLKERPREYAATVAVNIQELFSPTTEWHPHDRSPDSPHHRHRQVLGGYEAGFNRIVHGLPVAPVGLYALLPLAVLWALRRAWSLHRRGGNGDRARASLLAFCLLQIAYVTVSGVLVAFGEAPRYRFQIDPFIWLILALAAADLWRWAGLRLTRARPGGQRTDQVMTR